MNRLEGSPPVTESSSCASFFVPSVTVANDWVSPREKIAEPWRRGNTPTCAESGRISCWARPSMRSPFSSTFLRTVSISSASKRCTKPTASTSGHFSATFLRRSSLIAETLPWRSSLPLMRSAAARASPPSLRMKSILSAGCGTSWMSLSGLPSARRISIWRSMIFSTSSCARLSAAMKSSSLISLAEPSIMRNLPRMPA